jgi:NDP-sugar pyrophosphorylase family protein
MKQAVILAGGRGERLRPITEQIPKPIAPVNGIPFLDYLINSVRIAGFSNILLLIGYKGQQIRKRYENVKNLHIEFHQGTEDDETGRRLLNAHHLLDDVFLLMYGDNYWPIEIDQILEQTGRNRGQASTTVFSNVDGTGEYGYGNNIAVNSDGRVLRYDKTRRSSSLNGVDIGYFYVPRNLLDTKITTNVSFENHILPSLIAANLLTAYITHTQYYYITDLQSLNQFARTVQTKGFAPLPQCFFT